MATVIFTENLQRHVSCPPCDVPGRTVRQALEAAFANNAQARGYVLDDQGALREHMVVFVKGRPIADRIGLTDPIGADDEIYVIQALSGG